MKNKFIFILLILFIFISLISIKIKTSEIKTPPKESKPKVHLYNNPRISLEKVNLSVFYVVSKETSDNNWFEVLKTNLEKIKTFHSLQFKKLSNLEYKIYPQPLILDIENLSFTEDISQNNIIKALKIAEEVENFIIQQKIDKDFYLFPDDVYNVLVIIYEGAGLYGGLIADAKISFLERNIIQETTLHKFQGFVFISKDYLIKNEFKKIGATLLYHELAHTFGIPDKYNQKTFFSLDIMGRGRFEPLENNYLEHQILSKMSID